MKLRDLADRLDCRLDGDGEVEIRRVAGIERAESGDLTFFVNPRYTHALRGTQASAVILAEDADAAPCAMLRSSQPYVAFAQAVSIFDDSPPPPSGIDPLSAIAQSAVLGPDISIGPFVTIGERVRIGRRAVIYPNVVIARDVTIGDDCVLHSQVAVREKSRIGSRVVIQNGAVIGGAGFGFATRPDGTHEKIPQIGIVVIEDDVEIGANTAIDRPALGETRVCAGAKIDNLVQIAHGVTVGRNALLAAQVGVAGSTVIGESVVLAGQVGVAGHLHIGKGVVATAQSGIPNSVEAGSFISGYPAIDNREWLKSAAVFRRLPDLKRTIHALEQRVAELEAKLRER